MLEVVWKCNREPSALVAIMTFLVTPGASNGLHLIFNSNNSESVTAEYQAILAVVEKYVYLPHTSCRHWILHTFVADVTHLARVQIEDLDGTILLGSRNILVVIVKAH